MEVQSPRGCELRQKGERAERLKQREAQRSQREADRITTGERRRQRVPGLLLSGTLGVRQAPQGFFQLQEVFSMPYL